MRILFLMVMGIGLVGCGPPVMLYNAPDRAPAMPSACTYLRADGASSISPGEHLYVYSCATSDASTAYVEYVNKFGMLEKVCLDDSSHACQ